MKINISLKTAANAAKSVAPVSFYIAREPHSVKELIEGCVISCLDAYREKYQNGPRSAQLSDEEFRAMEEVGRFTFGPLGEFRDVPETQAIHTAIEAYTDGLVRIFQNDCELCRLDQAIETKEDDIFTFVRLAFLSGRMW